MNNEVEFQVPKEKWDFVMGKTRLNVRRILLQSFNTQGLQHNIHPATEAIMDIIDAAFDVLRGADKPIMARNWRPLLREE